MGAGQKNRRVQFHRAIEVDDGFTKTEEFEPYGNPVWARKRDIGDAERWRAGAVDVLSTTRFVVSYGAFTSGITEKDRLSCEGRDYAITGIKEIGRRRRNLEITTSEIRS